jgi:hypothetical protein
MEYGGNQPEAGLSPPAPEQLLSQPTAAASSGTGRADMVKGSGRSLRHGTPQRRGEIIRRIIR